MSLPAPTPDNDYELTDLHVLTGELISAIFKSISDRLKARENLEADFEALIAEGTQAALQMIQTNLTPQLADLQQAVTDAEQTIADIAANGVAPNSEKLGGELPAYYAAVSSLANYLLKSSTENLEVGHLIKLQDDDGEHDFWAHVNANRFFILTDRDGNGTWELDGPNPLELRNDESLAYAYGERLAKHSELPTITASTSPPSGGNDGDIHLQYID